MSERTMKCELCGATWGCRSYDDSECPECDQQYVYDEDIHIRLTNKQRDILRNNLVYITTMYRWADRENHSYVLGVYDSEELARKNAEEEEVDRGGKYSAEIILYAVNDGSAKTRKLIKELE